MSEAKLVKAMMEGAPRPSIEIGVGSGFFALAANVDVGLDPSINMLRLARGRGVDNLVLEVGERMPLRDSAAGSVLVAVTLCFVDDPTAVLRESYRVLRSGGYVVVCIVPRDSPWGRYYVELGSRGHRFYSRAKFYTVSEVAEMLETSGFRVVGLGATLSTPPGESPRVEEPSADVDARSFVCVKAVKES